MKKISLSIMTCVLLFSFLFSPFQMVADDDHMNKEGNGQKEDTSTPLPKANTPEQLQMLQLGQYINHVLFHYMLPVVPRKPEITAIPPKPRLLKVPKFGKRFGRAVLEGVGHFLYATASYWIRQDVMKEDWEYQLTWEDQKRRFLFIDGMRFDSNTFQFNWTHSMAGAIYFNYARGNHLNMLESSLFTLGSSYFWEFFVEFKEVVSINDMICTTIGGISIGEAFYQSGRYYRSQSPTFLNKIGRFLSNPVLFLNDWLDRKRYKNQFAFTEDYSYDIRLSTGTEFTKLISNDPGTLFHLGYESELITIPEYGSPGTVARNVGGTVSTQLNLNASLYNTGVYELNIFARSVLFGYFSQKIQSDLPIRDTDGGEGHPITPYASGDDRTGYSFFIGAASAFDMTKKNPSILPGFDETIVDLTIPDNEDKYTVINLLGPTVDFSLFHKDLKIRLAADAYGDFALVHSHAFKHYSQLNQFGKTKSTLENHGYYYALGITLSSLFQLNYSNVEVKGKLKYHYFDSIEGLDRFQKDIEDEDDFNLKDQRLSYNLSLGYRIPNTSLQVVLGLEQYERWGDIEDFSRHSTETRSYVQLKVIF
jgi:hypothetical protein